MTHELPKFSVAFCASCERIYCPEILRNKLASILKPLFCSWKCFKQYKGQKLRRFKCFCGRRFMRFMLESVQRDNINIFCSSKCLLDFNKLANIKIQQPPIVQIPEPKVATIVKPAPDYQCPLEPVGISTSMQPVGRFLLTEFCGGNPRPLLLNEMEKYSFYRPADTDDFDEYELHDFLPATLFHCIPVDTYMRS